MVRNKTESEKNIDADIVTFLDFFTSMLDEILQTRIMVKASMKRWKADKVSDFNNRHNMFAHFFINFQQYTTLKDGSGTVKNKA